MTTTTTHRPQPAAPRAVRAPRPVEPSGAGSLGLQSAAFVGEVRRQWALTATWYDDAVARGDDLDRQDALERFTELRELLWHHDLSLEALHLDAPR